MQRAEAVVSRDCDLIRDRYTFYVTDWSEPAPADDARLRTDLTAAVTIALAHEDGIEGGIWQSGTGSLAYAYPTYAGTGPKTDLPLAERDRIETINQQTAREDQSNDVRAKSRGETLLLHACPLAGPIAHLTAWTMTRVRSAAGVWPLQLGLGTLFGLTILMSVSLGRTLLVWTRHVRTIEAALSRSGTDAIPSVEPTGEREFDRIIAALNDASARLAEAHADADEMAARIARSERLAGLGRVAAGVAHEIRNPIAALRLQGENALAGDSARQRDAIEDMLTQINRLDNLVSELLAMTQRVEPRPVLCDLTTFLGGAAAAHRDMAALRHITIDIKAQAGHATLDPALIGRILDNLLSNAIRHAPDGGKVVLRAIRDQRTLLIEVENSGDGISPDIAGRLFEPFATGRPDGTGLGLAIARELADAHGGQLELRRADTPSNTSTVFVLELPQEDAWQPS